MTDKKPSLFSRLVKAGDEYAIVNFPSVCAELQEQMLLNLLLKEENKRLRALTFAAQRELMEHRQAEHVHNFETEREE